MCEEWDLCGICANEKKSAYLKLKNVLQKNHTLEGHSIHCPSKLKLLLSFAENRIQKPQRDTQMGDLGGQRAKIKNC